MRAPTWLLLGRGVSPILTGRRDGRSMEAAPGVGCVHCWGVGCRRLPAGDGDVLIMYGGSVIWRLVFAGCRLDDAGDVEGDGLPHDSGVLAPIHVGEQDPHACHFLDRHVTEPLLGVGTEPGVRVNDDLNVAGGGVSECPVLVERVVAAGDDCG